jgi:SAM-dependent methyltransferase
MHNAPMRLDDRFDDLVASLAGFYRTWYVFTGLELGLFDALRDAGTVGLTAAELAARTGVEPALAGRWAWGADAFALVESVDGRIRVPGDVATILLDADRPEFLGGQFQFAAVGSLDYDQLPSVFRTGKPVLARPDRYRVAIERLTVQDVAVFFEEVLTAFPQLVVALRPGAKAIDVHSGGGRWLIAMARRFPGLALTGIEFEPDSVARSKGNVAEAGLADRVAIEQGSMLSIGHVAEADLVYFQYALHQLPDPVATLRSAWAAVKPGGWLVALDWHLPSDPDELRTPHGELIAGVQLDEVVQGTRLVTASEALGWFAAAGLPPPELVDLPSGASAIVLHLD